MITLHKEGTYNYLNDVEFIRYVKMVEGNTLIDIDRLYIIYQTCLSVKNKDGYIAEVGVYKGGSAKLINKLLPEDRLYLFDTFDGMPEVDEEKDSFHKRGDFNDTSLQSV